jgi:hypothetical protein
VQYEYQEMTPSVPAAPVIPSILTVHQIEFLYDAARWRSQAGWPRPWSVYRHLRNMDFELRALACAHRVIVMSPEDAGRLRRFVPDLPSNQPDRADTRGYSRSVDRRARPRRHYLANFQHGRTSMPRAGSRTISCGRLTPDPRASSAARWRELADHLRPRHRHAQAVDDRAELRPGARALAPVRFRGSMRGKVSGARDRPAARDDDDRPKVSARHAPSPRRRRGRMRRRSVTIRRSRGASARPMCAHPGALRLRPYRRGPRAHLPGRNRARARRRGYRPSLGPFAALARRLPMPLNGSSARGLVERGLR